MCPMGLCVWTLDPQQVALFWKVLSPWGHAASLGTWTIGRRLDRDIHW